MTTFNWDHLKQRARAGGAVPEDVYTLELSSAKSFESAKGNVGLKLRFKIYDGAYEDALVFHTMTILPEYPSLMAQFFESLDALGIPESALYGDVDLDDIAEQLEVNLPKVRAKVTSDEFNGRKNNKVQGDLMPFGTTSSAGFKIAAATPTPAAKSQDEVPF